MARTTLIDDGKTKNNSDFLKIKGNQDGNKWNIDYTKGDTNGKHEFDDKAVREFFKKDKILEFVLKYLAGQQKLY